jgi:hypothetical protein
MDATRISDGASVALKSIKPSVHPYEVEIGTYLSSEPLASDPKNHCVPIYEVLDVPDVDDRVILVMPFLRRYNRPPLQTFQTFFSNFLRYIVTSVFSSDSSRLLTPFGFQGITIHARSSPRCASVRDPYELHHTPY